MYGHPSLGYMPGYKPRRNSSIPDAVRTAFASPAAFLASLKPASVTHAEVGFFSSSTTPAFFGGDVVAPSETAVDFRNDPKKASRPERSARSGKSPSETPVDRSADSRLGLKNGR